VVDPVALDRRDFLRVAGVGAGAALLSSGCASVPSLSSAAPARGIDPRLPRGGDVGHIVVIGAGIWGSWTAYHLRERGVRVTLVDQYGAGNSRSTSGDETRGIRSSYGDRDTGELWTQWARSAIKRWELFDSEWGPEFGTKYWHKTGDVIMRTTEDTLVRRSVERWKANNVPHEVISGDEARKRWPIIKADDITIAITEPDAGVVRARAATQAVAAVAQKKGATLIVSRAKPGPIVNRQMQGVILEDGTVVRGDAYVFACGPWLRKLFPYMENRMNVPLGFVCYFGVPVGDTRFTFPNLPSFNFPGVTGWPVLPVDFRGFRVRGAIAAPSTAANAAAGGAGAGGGAGRGGAAAAAPAAPGAATPRPATVPDPTLSDPDLSARWMSPERIEGSRRFLQARFPLLANAPLLETRACHYEGSTNRNFIVDFVPDTTNAWIAGVGQSEGFKFGPVAGDYVAQRVVGIKGDPTIADAFKLPTATNDTPR
jgi:glycine/D-amino acid oxidase-like deaminating enzyme